MPNPTPAPWFVHKEPTGFGEFSHIITDAEDLEDDAGAPICGVHFTNDAEANARLIAAAPGLLAALEGAKKAIADVLDNCPYFFPDRGIAANLTPEQAAWRKKVQGANDAARAALKVARQ